MWGGLIICPPDIAFDQERTRSPMTGLSLTASQPMEDETASSLVLLACPSGVGERNSEKLRRAGEGPPLPLIKRGKESLSKWSPETRSCLPQLENTWLSNRP